MCFLLDSTAWQEPNNLLRSLRGIWENVLYCKAINRDWIKFWTEHYINVVLAKYSTHFICQMAVFLRKWMGPAAIELSWILLQGLHLQCIVSLRINLNSSYFTLHIYASWAVWNQEIQQKWLNVYPPNLYHCQHESCPIPMFFFVCLFLVRYCTVNNF